MLLPFILAQFVIASFANPFHKYPYVFLLDVGNEEIEKANTEQLRLSIPGGSLAVKYPAAGEGDTIGHVRVSGIDFGTDLKASIVEGGPGYKYVVLAFVGNPGVAYDAVVTIQTLPSTDVSDKDNTDDMNSDTINENIANDSAEDTSDDFKTKLTYSESMNNELSQSSSNLYEYKSYENTNGDDDNVNNSEEDFQDKASPNVNNIDEDENDNNDDDTNDYNLQDSQINDDNSIDDLNNKQNGKYEAFKPHFYGGIRFYPQNGIYTQDEYSKPVYELQADNDEEGINDEQSAVNKDTNNNVDVDYNSPVEY